MITDDRAMEIAREVLADDIRKGGLPTLLGYADHWRATCTFPDNSMPAGHKPLAFRIDAATGEVSAL